MADATTTDRPATPSSDQAGPPRHNGQSPAEVEAALAAAGHARRRRWPLLLFGMIVGGAAVGAALTYLDGRDQPAEVQSETVELATAGVEQRDLQEEIEWSGTLGYGQPVSVSSSGGIVTATPAEGSVLERGDVMAWVDAEPVVVFYGDVPMWRTLRVDVEGTDVLQLEANLAALGYDPDGNVNIDGVFTANTEAMVERWQTDIGQELTGEVEPGDVVVVQGPSSLVSVADIGSSANGLLASLAPRRTVTDVVASTDGLVTDLAPVGTSIGAGTTLFRVDDVPVVTIDPGDPVADVLLSSTYTATELEEALAAAGYDPDGEMTVDGVITEATEAAVERWQEATDLPLTGQADPAWYLATPTGHAVDAHLIETETELFTGGPVLTTSTSQLSVDVVVEVAEADEFTVGQMVTIELADESTADGEVVEIGAVSSPDGQGDPTVTIVIDVVTGDDESLIEGPVTVVSIGEEIAGATVVPVRALVALAEGGFAVEKAVDDGTTRLIAVEVGTFDDGLVEIVEGELVPGDRVVVPR